MKRGNPNTWLKARAAEEIEWYLSSADVIVVERKRSIRLLGELFAHHFSEPAGLRVLDLGGGDGLVTEYFSNQYPRNDFCLMDGSVAMLDQAKARLKGRPIRFVEKSFEAYAQKGLDPDGYDFIFSSMAIHHLPLKEKGALYARVHRELRGNGLFLVFDVVAPVSPKSERLQFRMWVDWMNEALRRSNFAGEVGKFDGFPAVYKAKAENHPSRLLDQLDQLKKAGFKNVDCFFKYGIFSLFGGTK